MADSRFRERYGPLAVVTGAAVGMGRGFARRIAARGLDLLLADKEADTLKQTAEELRQQHGVQVATVVADLSTAQGVETLCGEALEREVGLLVNNAGFGHTGWFMQIPLEDHLGVVDLNVRATLILTHRLGRKMLERGRGGIIFVASNSSEHGAPTVAHYAATKAYVRMLGEALFAELEEQGVDSLALSPGLTRTRTISQRLGDELARKLGAMEPEDVAEEGLRALGKRPALIAGARNRMQAILSRDLMPRARTLRNVMKQMQRTGLGKPQTSDQRQRDGE
jgi:hypothetical protein